ncbi:hypothetical protein TNCV_1858031 [Trichonephila clavipes]|nr:hypothetical protein TNCV_1858031 [Trichonephila clavipes]
MKDLVACSDQAAPGFGGSYMESNVLCFLSTFRTLLVVPARISCQSRTPLLEITAATRLSIGSKTLWMCSWGTAETTKQLPHVAKVDLV